MSVVVHSSLICDASIACVVLYASSVDVGGCPGPLSGMKLFVVVVDGA